MSAGLLLASILAPTIGCKSELRVEEQLPQLYAKIEQQFITGDLLSAQHDAENASRRLEDTNAAWSAKFRVELARIYLYQGESGKATALLKETLPPEVDRELIIRQQLLLAMAEIRLSDAGSAHKALAAAEALHPQGAMYAEMVGAQGSVALEQGKLDQAQFFFQEALDEAHLQHVRFLETQMAMDLGVIALQRERYEDALERFLQTYSLAQSIGARQALEKASGNLGQTYYKTGDFARALQSSEIAAKEAEVLGATLDEIHMLTNAGLSQFALADLGAARVSYENALALAKRLNNTQLIIDTHVALAYLLLHRQPEAAAMHVSEASRLARLSVDQSEGLEPLLLEALLLAQQGQDATAELRLHDLVKKATVAPSFQWVAENTLAGLYAKEGKDREADRWFQAAIATFHRQRLSLKSVELELPFLENGNDLYLGYVDHLIREGRSHEALMILDQSRAETLAEGLGDAPAQADQGAVSTVSVRVMAARLHGTILVYCLRPQSSYLWAISAKQEKFYTLPSSAAILPLVERHTQAVLASKDLLAQKDHTGQQLYDALVKPAESLLGHQRKVFLIADKGLGGLNFETLVTGGDQPHYWIEDVALTNARSLRLLGHIREPSHRRAPPAILLIGDPVYRSGEYPALPNAAAEMNSVAGHFNAGSRSVLAGLQASPGTYASSMPGGFEYIHFVAHATANETNPLDSAIILSGSPESSADRPAANKLYARDILRQPLRAELVTISSCYGSGTRNYSGEGVVGLVWAFLRAGAHSVIGAMWEVSDVSTPQLMDSFYTQLLSGSTPDEALRSAKLVMLHGGGVFRKPLYWASFQLYSGR